MRQNPIKGFEVMRALRKGEASAFNITKDIRGEAHIVERAFGLGASALAEAVTLGQLGIQGQAAPVIWNTVLHS